MRVLDVVEVLGVLDFLALALPGCFNAIRDKLIKSRSVALANGCWVVVGNLSSQCCTENSFVGAYTITVLRLFPTHIALFIRSQE